MAVVLALPKLFDDVKELMDDDAAAAIPPTTPVPQSFGWREPAKRSGTRRIVWVPGDDESGDLGKLAAAKSPGRNPRPLATLGELFTVYLEAQDPAAPETERNNYQIARELFDAWLRAVHLSAHGTYAIVSARWLIEKNVRRFGTTIRVLGTIEAMVPDAALETAPVDTHAEIDTSELNVTETTTTE